MTVETWPKVHLRAPTVEQGEFLVDEYLHLVRQTARKVTRQVARRLGPTPTAEDARLVERLWRDEAHDRLAPTIGWLFQIGAATVRAQLMDHHGITAAAGEIRERVVKEALAGVTNEQLAETYLGSSEEALAGASVWIWDHLREVLAEALEAQTEALETAMEEGMPPAKVEAVARNQVHNALQQGALAQAKASAAGGGGEKEWRSMRDDRVRPTHVEADGQRVGLNELFTVGGWPADRPHDPALPAHEAAECRCHLEFYLPQPPDTPPPEAQRGLVRRRRRSDAALLARAFTRGVVGRGMSRKNLLGILKDLKNFSEAYGLETGIDRLLIEPGNEAQLAAEEQVQVVRELAAVAEEEAGLEGAAERLYSPTQPRGKGGKWTPGGGGGGTTPAGHPEHPDLTGDLVLDVGVDPATARQIQTTTDALADRYGPEIKRAYPMSTSPGAPPGAIAAMDNNGNLYVDPVMLDPSRLRLAVAMGQLAPGDDRVEGVLTHEYAHRLFQAPDRSDKVFNAQLDAFKGIERAGYDRRDLGKLQKQLSAYAGADGGEGQAEMFSNYHFGGDSRPAWVVGWGEALHKSLGVDRTPLSETGAAVRAAASPDPEPTREVAPPPEPGWMTPGFVIPDPDPEPDAETAAAPNQARDRRGRWTDTGGGGGVVAPITADEARGDSRPVTLEEFGRIAGEGQDRLAELRAHRSPPEGLDRNWQAIRDTAFAETRKSWGGATFDAHTGKTIQPTEGYVLSIKNHSDSVTLAEGAKRAEFDRAMDTARRRFGDELSLEGGHLGVFHDDEGHRVDIDPVVVVKSRRDVETIGAATHAIGGAYSFADGNGYWPPHVAAAAAAAASEPGSPWRGLGEWYANVRRTQHRGAAQASAGRAPLTAPGDRNGAETFEAPGQPRDRSGKWTDGPGGGGGGGTVGGVSYDSPAAAKKFLDDHYGTWKRKDLTDAEYAGLSFYQSPGFALMNGQRRGLAKDQIKADMSFTDQDLKRARTASKDLSSGIAKAPPLKEATLVHRGFDAAQFGQLKPGARVVDKGFVSTSLTSQGVASVGKAGKPGVMRLELPAGTRAGAGSARELILDGATIEVVGVRTRRGVTEVDARLVGGAA